MLALTMIGSRWCHHANSCPSTEQSQLVSRKEFTQTMVISTYGSKLGLLTSKTSHLCNRPYLYVSVLPIYI